MKKRFIRQLAKILVFSICVSVLPVQWRGQNVSAATLPASYDARDYGYVTEKKVQSKYGTCWAFATIAAAEASLIKSGLADKDINLSEYHTAYYTYKAFNDPLGNMNNQMQTPFELHELLNNGGRFSLASQQFAKWSGPVLETTMPYTDAVNEIEPSKDLSTESLFHLKKAIFAGSKNRDSIKELILQYGIVATDIYTAPARYLNYKDYPEITYHIPNVKVTDHAVCIVGWDDNYPKEHFNYPPNEDGAWLVKNSDGANQKYMWISYETHIGSACAIEFEPADRLENNYQYDVGVDGSTIFNSLVASSNPQVSRCMNVFKAKRSQKTLEKLEAVMIHGHDNFTHKIQIYVNPVIADGQMVSYEYKSEPFEYYTKHGGIYTVDVPEDIYLNDGDTFGIEILDDPNYPIDQSIYFHEEVNPGESFIGKTEKGKFEYVDLANYNRTGNLEIKGFTNSTKIPPVKSIRINKDSAKINVGKEFSINATIQVPAGGLDGISYISSDPAIATVDSAGKVKGIAPGTVTITVKSTYGTATAECNVEVMPVATSLTAETSLNLLLSGSYQLNPVTDVPTGFSYTSSNPNVARVDSSGRVIAVNPGTATVTIKTMGGSNLTATCVVTVTRPQPQPTTPTNPIPGPQPPSGGNIGTIIPTPTTTMPSVTASNTTVPATKKNRVKRGTEFSNGSFKYSVTTSNREVEVIGTINKKATSLKIPATVKYNGVRLKVTGINQMTFSGLTKLKSISVGVNMERIEKKAFSGCKSLKTIKMPGEAIRYVEKNAFKGIPANAKITVPKKKYESYKKIFKDAGLSSKVTWKKK